MSASFASADALNFAFDTNATGTVLNSGTSVVTGWFQWSIWATNDVFWYAGGIGGGTRLRMATTNGELALLIDRATTDYTWTSLDAQMAANTWYFLATVIHAASTLTHTVWIGSETTPPRVVTTNTSTVGLGTMISGTSLTLGSAGVSGTHIDGLISQVFNYSGTTDTTIALSDPVTYDRFIYPLWAGTFDPMTARLGTPNGSVGVATDRIRWMPLDAAYTDTTVKFPSYSVTRTTNAGTITHVSTNTAGAPGFSQSEPRTRRRADVGTCHDLPLLLRR